MSTERKRLFLAAPVPEAIARSLANAETLNQGIGTARWVKQANYHLTVKFLGQVSMDDLLDVISELELVCAQIQPFDLEYLDIKFMPVDKRPRIIWAEFGQSDAYVEAVQFVEEALGSVIRIKPEPKPIPHITIARLSKGSGNEGGELPKLVKPQVSAFQLRVNEFVLYESFLDGKGADYSVISKHDLAG